MGSPQDDVGRGPHLKSLPYGICTDQQWIHPSPVFHLLMINGSIFPFLSQVLNPKKKGKKKKKYQNSGTVWQHLAVYRVNMADGVYSVQTLIDRSPSCLAWWTLNSPSWTTYEGGKYSSAGVPGLWMGTVCRRCWEDNRQRLSLSWNIKTDNLLLNHSLLPALNRAAV